MSRVLLTETIPVKFDILEESALPEGKRDGRMRIVGRFQQVEVKNENGRRYRKEILGRELQKLNERIGKGHPSSADHPVDGKSRFSNVAAKLEEAVLGEDGWVTGRMALLNTSTGKDAQEVIRSGIQVHVSARGFGTLKPTKMPDGDNVQDVAEDYDLVTYDLVLSDPGFRGADVTSFTEEKVPMKTVEELKAAYPELAAQIEKAAGDKAVSESKDALTKEITEQMKAAQPAIDKQVEDKVAAEKDAIKAAVIEQLKAEGIEEAKGLLAKIAEIIAPYLAEAKCPKCGQEMPEDEDEDDDKKPWEELNAEATRLQEANAALQKQVDDFKSAQKAAEVKASVDAHIAEALKDNKNAAKIIPLLGKCATVAEVDAELPKVQALVESLAVAVDPKDAKRKGTPVIDPEVKDPGKAPADLTEEQKTQRRLSGLE